MLRITLFILTYLAYAKFCLLIVVGEDSFLGIRAFDASTGK